MIYILPFQHFVHDSELILLVISMSNQLMVCGLIINTLSRAVLFVKLNAPFSLSIVKLMVA